MDSKIMQSMGFGKQVELVKESKCPFCKTLVSENDFTDEKSKKEFRISGLCSKCQAEMFPG